MEISIAKDFTTTPGPRNITQGDFSGELFRKTILEPRYIEAKKTNQPLDIILDGTYGYYDSFLEEAFGGLQRIYRDEKILNYINIISNETPAYKEVALKSIEDVLKNNG